MQFYYYLNMRMVVDKSLFNDANQDGNLEQNSWIIPPNYLMSKNVEYVWDKVGGWLAWKPAYEEEYVTGRWNICCKKTAWKVIFEGFRVCFEASLKVFHHKTFCRLWSRSRAFKSLKFIILRVSCKF